MLNKVFSISLAALSITVSTAFSKTLTLRPGSEGKDAVVFSRSDVKDRNFGASARIHAETWTWDNDGLGQGTYRSLFAFDLQTLPVSAVIKSAKLYLYGDTLNYTKGHSSLSASNAAYLQRVKQAWAETTVTWNNQPEADSIGRITLAQSKNSTQDYEVDVTALVQSMAADSSRNHGFLLRSVTESPYNSMSFGSGDHADSTLHPKLVIEYEEDPSDRMVLRPGSEGKDAVVFSRADAKDRNFGASARIHAETWTWNNDGFGQGTYRSLIEFDLKDVPRSATVKSAKLFLYCDTVNYTKGHSSLTTSNAAYLQRVKQAWAETTVTWNNQPEADSIGRITLTRSSETVQDYGVDVTDLVAAMVAEPSKNFGLMLSSIKEAPYNSMSFGSGDHADKALHPKLEIRFTKDVTRAGRMGGSASGERLSMTLRHGASTRELHLSRPATGFVTDLQGKVVARFENAGSVSLAGFNRGAYVLAANGSMVKFVVQ